MKHILFLLSNFIVTFISAQNIQLESPGQINRNGYAKDNYDLRYSITNHKKDETYILTITDNLEGTAKQDIDYILPAAPKKIIDRQYNSVETVKIILPEISPCNTTDKTIILHIEAIPKTRGAATINATFTLIIHRTDKLGYSEKLKCKNTARRSGKAWPTNFSGIDPYYDTTNIARTEFISYTDFKGFDPDQPNGLAQSQFLFKWPIIKKWSINNPKFKLQFLRSFMFPNFLFNRIDKSNDALLYKPKYDSLVSASGNKDSFVLKSRNVTSFDIIKYSNFILNGKVILVNFKFEKSKLYLEWNATLYRMRVDSSKIATSFDPVYAISNGPMLFFETGNFGKSDEFGLRTTFSTEKIKILSNSFSQVDGLSSINNNLAETNPKTVNDKYVDKSSFIWNLTARLSRSVSKDDKSQIFFKYNLSWQKLNNPKLADEQSLKNSYNFFSQFQVGLDLNMDVFGK